MLIDQLHYNFKLEAERIDSQDKLDLEPVEIDAYLNKAIWTYLKERYSVLPDKPKRGFETDQMRITQLSSLHIKSPHVQPGLTPTLIEDGLYELQLNELGNNINGQFFRYLFLTDGYIKAKKGNCNKRISLSHHQVDDTKTIYTASNWTWRRVNYNFGKSTFINSHVLPEDSNQSPDVTMDIVDESPRNNNDELSSLYLDTRDKYGDPQFEIETVYLSYIKYPNRVFFGGYDHIDRMSTSDSPKIHCDFDEITCNDIVSIAVRLAEKDIKSDYNAMIQDEIRNLKN